MLLGYARVRTCTGPVHGGGEFAQPPQSPDEYVDDAVGSVQFAPFDGLLEQGVGVMAGSLGLVQGGGECVPAEFANGCLAAPTASVGGVPADLDDAGALPRCDELGPSGWHGHGLGVTDQWSFVGISGQDDAHCPELFEASGDRVEGGAGRVSVLRATITRRPMSRA